MKMFRILKFSLFVAIATLLLTACKSDSSTTPSTPGTPPPGTPPTGPVPPRPTLGLPDQDSFDLTRSIGNVEAFNISGSTSIVTIRLAGKLNDKTVYDGKRVYFSAEGGRIDDFCTILNGDCSVTWNGQDPRPLDGRASIIAWTDGFESFIDRNDNGLFDDGDLFYTAGLENHDVPEPFRDDNENTLFDANEEFRDFNANSVYDLADGLYNGAACADTTGRCSAIQTLFIHNRTVIVMSGSGAFFSFDDCNGGALADPLQLILKDTTFICVTIVDARNNPMPATTAVALDTDASATLVGPSSIPNSTNIGGTSFGIRVKGGETGESKILQVKTTTPSGAFSISNVVRIRDSAKPP